MFAGELSNEGVRMETTNRIKPFMRLAVSILIYFIVPLLSLGQSKCVVSVTLSGFDNYYHTTNDNNYLGNALRYGNGFGLSVDVIDTSGRKPGFKIDVIGYSIDNYYKNVLPNNQLLNVGDDLLLVDYLFKVFQLHRKLLSTNANLGLGINTLLNRQYFDEYGNDLGYNSTYLKDEARFGKNFGLMAIGEIDLNLRVMKRLTINGGIRFWGSPTGQLTSSHNLTYTAYTGSGFAFMYGLSFRL